MRATAPNAHHFIGIKFNQRDKNKDMTTFNLTQNDKQAHVIQRLLAIATFTALTVLGAKITLESGEVPFTLQTMVVMLAGMVLGGRDAALSQIGYIGLLLIGLPVDARGLGFGVFAGPTWGFIVGFVPAAFVIGTICERFGNKIWVHLIAASIGASIYFTTGTIVLMSVTGMAFVNAFYAGVVKFVMIDFAKVLMASALARSPMPQAFWGLLRRGQ